MTHRIITGTEAKTLRENVAQIFAYPSAKVLITLCDLAFTVETLEAERDRWIKNASDLARDFVALEAERDQWKEQHAAEALGLHVQMLRAVPPYLPLPVEPDPVEELIAAAEDLLLSEMLPSYHNSSAVLKAKDATYKALARVKASRESGK